MTVYYSMYFKEPKTMKNSIWSSATTVDFSCQRCAIQPRALNFLRTRYVKQQCTGVKRQAKELSLQEVRRAVQRRCEALNITSTLQSVAIR